MRGEQWEVGSEQGVKGDRLKVRGRQVEEGKRENESIKTHNCSLSSPSHLSCVYMNDESLRQGKAKKLCLKTNPFFSREKEELPQLGFEPVTFCALGRRSTN